MTPAKKFELQKDLATFPVAEKDLPELLGCPTDSPTTARALMVEGTDWKKVGRTVRWTLARARSFASLVLLMNPDDVPELRLEAPLVAEPEVFTLKVLPRRTVNAHILLATDGVGTFRVRVKRKDNFRPNMEVRCTHVVADLFELVGNCPRYPGKY